MTAKYPNADTSPERLEEIIEDHFYDADNIKEPLGVLATWKELRDLLAMLEERTEIDSFYRQQYENVVKAADVFQCGGPLDYLLPLGASTTLDGTKAAAAEIARLKQQLHDQRWRCMTEEWPIQGQKIHVSYWGETTKQPFDHIEYFNREDYTNGEGIFWRPIPQLPTTYPIKLTRK